MIVEGYNVRECTCANGASVDFYEVKVYDQVRFCLTCNCCGSSSAACKTKEQAVHKWNASKTPLYG